MFAIVGLIVRAVIHEIDVHQRRVEAPRSQKHPTSVSLDCCGYLRASFGFVGVYGEARKPRNRGGQSSGRAASEAPRSIMTSLLRRSWQGIRNTCFCPRTN